MSIKIFQEQRVRDDLLNEYLKRGSYPSKIELEFLVNQFKSKQLLGMPEFKGYYPGNGEVSNKRKYNDMVNTIKKDLELTFRNLEYENNRLESVEEYYLTEKNQIQLGIKEIKKDIEIIDKYIENKDAIEIFYNSFFDFKYIELKGDLNRNIYKTDCFIDLRESQISLNPIYIKSLKQELLESEIQLDFKKQFRLSNALNPIEQIFSDNINQSWQQECIATSDGNKKVDILFEFKKEIEANLISIEMNSLKVTNGYLYIGMDLSNLYQIESYKSEEIITWNFESKKIKYIKIVLEKDECDISIGNDFYYYFGARKLIVKNQKFINQNKFISKPMKINKKYKSILIKANDYTPIDTKIEYYISKNTDEYTVNPSAVQWMKVNLNEELKLKNTEEVVQIYNKETERYGEVYKEDIGGKLYRIGEINSSIEKSIKLFCGQEMFQVEKKIFQQDKEANYESWKDVVNQEYKFVKVNSIKGPSFLEVNQNELGRLTCFIESEQEKFIELSIEEILSSLNFKLNVYVNRVQVKKINNKYNLFIKKGMNRVEIIYYSQSIANVSVAFTAINETEIKAIEKELNQISVHDLLYNTKENTFDSYSVDNGIILIPFDPVVFDIENEEVLFKSTHDILLSEDLFPQYLRLMIILKSESKISDITPIVKDYLIITK